MSKIVQSEKSRINVFLIVNLGCEMLFVLDQVLKFHKIPHDKSQQVIHEVMNVLLERKFIDALISGSIGLKSEQLSGNRCRFILKNMINCSLISLNDKPMERLWYSITMIFKWQLFMTDSHQQFIDIIFKHLSSINELCSLYCNKYFSIIDSIKNCLLDFWNSYTNENQLIIYKATKDWLQQFNMKISILMRLGFQTTNGKFQKNYFSNFKYTIGENIYIKSVQLNEIENRFKNNKNSKGCIEHLEHMLNSKVKTTADKYIKSNDIFKKHQNEYKNSISNANVIFSHNADNFIMLHDK